MRLGHQVKAAPVEIVMGQIVSGNILIHGTMIRKALAGKALPDEERALHGSGRHGL